MTTDLITRLEAKTYRRGNQLVRQFSPSEDALIEELRTLGMGTTEIAKFVNASHGTRRSPATINMRLKTLAINAERDEDDDLRALTPTKEPSE